MKRERVRNQSGGKVIRETDNVSQSVFVNCANVAALIARENYSSRLALEEGAIDFNDG